MSRALTASGRALFTERLDPSQICLDDIVHHLSVLPSNWGGNIEMVSYSAAQHALVASTACRLLASRPYILLLDAPYALHGQLTMWHPGCDWEMTSRDLEILEKAIYPAFHLPIPSNAIWEDISSAVQIAAATEWRDVVKGRHPDWQPTAAAAPGRIKFIPQPKVAETFRKALEAALRPFWQAA